MTRILPCLLALAAVVCADESPKPVNGLVWEVQVPKVVASVGPVEVHATLRNAGEKALQFEAAGKRPPLTLILMTDDGKPMRKPLPKQAQVRVGPAELVRGQPAWSITVDLRDAYGELAPGNYRLRVVHAAKGYTTDHPGFRPAEIASQTVRFEVVKTSLEAARKQSPPTPGFDFTVEKRKDGKGYLGVLVNRTKAAVTLLAYGDHPARPLNTTPMAEYWTGRGWKREGGGFCGTGLGSVTIAAGARCEISLPVYRGGIVRFAISVFEGKQERRVTSVPVIIDH
jgi:hypothetical protein